LIIIDQIMLELTQICSTWLSNDVHLILLPSRACKLILLFLWMAFRFRYFRFTIILLFSLKKLLLLYETAENLFKLFTQIFLRNSKTLCLPWLRPRSFCLLPFDAWNIIINSITDSFWLDFDVVFLDIDDPDVITDTTTLKISHDINQKDLIFRFFFHA
jgi:hypothetical protein